MAPAGAAGARPAPTSASPGMGRFKAVVLGLAVVVLAAGLYTRSLIDEQRRTLHDFAQYDVPADASQGAAELLRMLITLDRFRLGEDGADVDAVTLRLEILINRVHVLNRPQVRAFVAGHAGMSATIDRFTRAVHTAEQMLPDIARPGTAARMARVFQPFASDMVQLASEITISTAEHVARDETHLSRLHWLLSGVLAALLLSSVVLIGLLLRHNHLLRIAHRQLHGLAATLQSAGDELSRANRTAQAANDELIVQNRALHMRDAALNRSNAHFDAALNNMSQALCMVDVEERVIVCNRQYLALFGVGAGQVVPGRPIREVFAAIATAGRYLPAHIEAVAARQAEKAADRRAGMFCEEGADRRALAVSHQPMADGGWVATYEDVTERRRVEAHIEYLAHHDVLTGLPNRHVFRGSIADAMAALPRGEALAVYFLDLDRFKDVNDTLGHAAGDALLQAVAQRLRRCLRDGDVVARLGGDEFAVLQRLDDPLDASETLARRIVQTLNRPYDINGHRVTSSVSVGIAMAPTHGSVAEDLLRNADMALYCAKAAGRATWRRFDPDMDSALRARLAISEDLREAHLRGEMTLTYQPVLRLRDERITGFEALLRWHHPRRGLVSPEIFIPIAEEDGSIVPIGRWVLARACHEAMRWPPDVRIAVNLSPRHFGSESLTADVAAALEESGLPPERLILEITETALLDHTREVLASLETLRRMGIIIALDDFGTGYSSLGYLRSFMFDRIKIDRSFIQEIETRPDSLAIVQAISDLATKLGMSTTAEGIETRSQLRRLCAAGCAEGQGYLFDPPLAPEEALRRIAGVVETGAALVQPGD
ncbi:MAG TPA: EAL domain-containing protein [Acetobacteraceae bacterium]|nr:EAL domain-containing protein [Acetobacteraceae bacterium]